MIILIVLFHSIFLIFFLKFDYIFNCRDSLNNILKISFCYEFFIDNFENFSYFFFKFVVIREYFCIIFVVVEILL